MARSSCCSSKTKAIFAALTGIVFLALSITLFVLLFAYQSAKPDTPCAGLWGPVTYLHRGNLNFAQENTFDAVVNGSALLGLNPEIDVSALNDGGIVLFHDSTMKRMTGVDKNIKDVTTEEALSTPIVPEINGYTYNSSNFIPELIPVIEAICNIDETIGINFDTKSQESVKAGVSALKESKCKDTSDNVIWSSAYPNIISDARKELDAAGLNNRVGMYMATGEYYFLGLKFMLQTRLLHSLLSSGASILVLHKTVFDKDEALIQTWRDDGWCTGIFGISPQEVSKYNADYYVTDEGPVFPDLPQGGYGNEDGEQKQVVYEDDSLASYRGSIAAASLLLIASIVLFFFTWKWAKDAKKDRQGKDVQDKGESQDEENQDDINEEPQDEPNAKKDGQDKDVQEKDESQDDINE